MTTNWQYTDDTKAIVQREGSDGRIESCLVEAIADWIAEGNTPDPAPQLPFSDYVEAYKPGLQQWMEDTAASNEYDSVISCVSYVNDPVHQFAQDAVAMLAWRSALWVAAAEYQVGQHGQLPNPLPTLEQVKALMPRPEDFGWVVHEKGVIISAQTPPDQSS